MTLTRSATERGTLGAPGAWVARSAGLRSQEVAATREIVGHHLGRGISRRIPSASPARSEEEFGPSQRKHFACHCLSQPSLQLPASPQPRRRAESPVACIEFDAAGLTTDGLTFAGRRGLCRSLAAECRSVSPPAPSPPRISKQAAAAAALPPWWRDAEALNPEGLQQAPRPPVSAWGVPERMPLARSRRQSAPPESCRAPQGKIPWDQVFYEEGPLRRLRGASPDRVPGASDSVAGVLAPAEAVEACQARAGAAPVAAPYAQALPGPQARDPPPPATAPGGSHWHPTNFGTQMPRTSPRMSLSDLREFVAGEVTGGHEPRRARAPGSSLSESQRLRRLRPAKATAPRSARRLPGDILAELHQRLSLVKPGHEGALSTGETTAPASGCTTRVASRKSLFSVSAGSMSNLHESDEVSDLFGLEEAESTWVPGQKEDSKEGLRSPSISPKRRQALGGC